jgi:hypothetical protein
VFRKYNMTIDNLEAIVSPSSEDLLLIRHGGKEWKYPLSTLASNLVNDPTISTATLGTASHPFKTANITTLNVGGSGTVNGNLTVQATTDTTTAALLKVENKLTVKGDTTVSGILSTETMSVTSNTETVNLYASNLQQSSTPESRISNVYVSTSLTSPTLTATTATADYLYAKDITGSSSSPVSAVKADNLYVTDLGKDDSRIDTVNATTLTSESLTANTTNATTFNPGILKVANTASITGSDPSNGAAFTSGSLGVTGKTTVGGSFSTTSGNLNITNGSVTITNEFFANSLKVTGAGTVEGGATINGDVEAGSLNVADKLNVNTLTGKDGGNITEVAVSGTLSVKNLAAEKSTLKVTSGDITTSEITAEALNFLTITDSITTKALSMTDGTLTVRSGGTVTVGSSSSESGLMTIDSTGNIIAPSLVLMADTTVDLTNVEINPLAITSGTSVTSGEEATVDPEWLYAAGYLPTTECIISRAPDRTHLKNYGYLLTVTGGLRVGRSKDTYNKTPDERVILPGSYNVWGASIDKNGVISSGCADKCYGAGTATDSEGNETTEDGFLTAGGAVISEELQSNEDTFFTLLGGAIKTVGSIVSKSPIMGSRVFNAVWNDLADCIPVNKEAIIEPGYCYCFDGGKYYKSTKYLEKGIIGIESDTYGIHMGSKPGVKQMDVAVSGFALAYVDKEYEPGTPLTCTENGYLTEIAKQDKIEYPERIVGTYWKPEPNEEWGSSDRKVKVKGRHWIKIK